MVTKAGRRQYGWKVPRRALVAGTLWMACAGALGCGDNTGGMAGAGGMGGSAGSSGGAGGMAGIGGMAGVGGAGGNVNALEVTPIDDIEVIRNTFGPRSFSFDVAVPELQGRFTMQITSTDESVFSSVETDCDTSPCSFMAIPPADRNAVAQIEVTVRAGDRQGETSFTVRVQPRLVRDATDNIPPAPDSLRDVASKAEDGDIIGFDTEGAFSNDTTIQMASTLDLEGILLRIEGPQQPRVTIQSGEGYRALAVIDGAKVTIENVDFQGVRPLEGGLIRTSAGLTIANSTLRDAAAGSGAAILAGGTGRSRIENCTFTNNAASDGSAILTGTLTQIANTVFDSNGFDPIVPGTIAGALNASGPTELVNVSFFNNKAESGGALLIGGEAAVTMMGGTIGGQVNGVAGGNRATDGGGVFLTDGTALSLDSVRVEFNGAERGGAFFVGIDTSPGATLDIVSSRIEQNFASNVGGAIYLAEGAITMDTVSAIGPENEAGNAMGGGGIYVTGGGDVSGVPTERVAANRAGPSGAESNIDFDPAGF